MVDANTRREIKGDWRHVFDYVIDIEHDFAQNSDWKLSNEWQVFWLTPFKETLKVESDLLFTRNIDHWWPALQTQEVCLSHGCRDYQQHMSQNRRYRRVFDKNYLPDTYNGLMYFRYSKLAQDFFTTASKIFKNWETVRDQCLVDCRDKNPTTDLVYAIVASIYCNQCFVPTLDFFNFVHMKPGIQNWNDNQPWMDHVLVEHTENMIRINNVNQYYPVHYHDKKFIVDELINHYEQRITSIT